MAETAQTTEIEAAASAADAETVATPAAEKVADVKAIIALLAQKFPKCFSVEGEAKPLKIGIFRDLAERMDAEDDVSRTQLRHALRRYTSSWRYLKSVAKGGVRIDLDGEQGDVLETDHIEHAAKALEQSKERYEQRNKSVKDKKIYKKTQSDTGDKAKKQAKFNSDKQHSGATVKKAAHKSGAKPNKTVGSTTKQAALSPLTETQNKPGTRVLVKFGQSPVAGVIKEVGKEEIHVQLNSGMVIKTRFENIFLA